MNNKVNDIYQKLLKLSEDEKNTNANQVLDELFKIDLDYEHAKQQLKVLREGINVC